MAYGVDIMCDMKIEAHYRRGSCHLTEIGTLAIQPHTTQLISCDCVFQ